MKALRRELKSYRILQLSSQEETLQNAAKTAANGNIIPIVGDVSDKESLQAVTDRVRKEHGYINLLFANAGVSGPSTVRDTPALSKGEKPTIQEMQEGLLKPEMQAFTQAYHVNVTGVYFTAAAFLDLLDAGNKRRNLPQDSQILVTSSVAGFSRFLNNGFAYSCSKAGTNHLVKMLATAFAQNGFHIRCQFCQFSLTHAELY